MSALPIALHGERMGVVVVGGGTVATRKALAFAAAGSRVTVISPDLSTELVEAGSTNRIQIERSPYRRELLANANLVVAATSSRQVNSQVAADARAMGKLVNVADSPGEGDFSTMAIHRSGDIVIAVSAGGVPGAAARIRDAIADRFDDRYGRAVSALRGLRTRLLNEKTNAWKSAAPALIGDDFCESVESGSFTEKVASWQ